MPGLHFAVDCAVLAHGGDHYAIGKLQITEFKWCEEFRGHCLSLKKVVRSFQLLKSNVLIIVFLVLQTGAENKNLKAGEADSEVDNNIEACL